jgi:polyketide biosynthesis acyl carrier protein
MTKADIFAIIQGNLQEVLPRLHPEQIRPEVSMRDLGANSIDRADVVVKSMADCELKIPLIRLAKVNNLAGIVEVFYQALQEAASEGT